MRFGTLAEVDPKGDSQGVLLSPYLALSGVLKHFLERYLQEKEASETVSREGLSQENDRTIPAHTRSDRSVWLGPVSCTARKLILQVIKGFRRRHLFFLSSLSTFTSENHLYHFTRRHGKQERSFGHNSGIVKRIHNPITLIPTIDDGPHEDPRRLSHPLLTPSALSTPLATHLLRPHTK